MKTRFLTGLLATALLAGCGDSLRPATTVPGTLSIVFDAVDDSTGALVVSVSGGTVDSIAAGGGGVYGTSAPDPSGATVLLTGNLVRGSVIGTVYLADVESAGTIVATVVEAANRVTNDQRAPASVSVRLLP